LALAVCASLLSACGGDDGESTAAKSASTSSDAKKPIKVAFFNFTLGNPYGIATAGAAKKAAAAAGSSVEVFDAQYTPATQVNQIQDATVSGKYEAFVIGAIDGAAVAPALMKAIDEGIKVVAWYTPIGKNPSTLDPQIPGLTSTVADPLVDNGIARGELVVKACESLKKATCTVALETGPISGSFEKIRLDSVKSVLEKHPDIKVVATPALAAYSAEAGRTSAQDLAQAHPDLDVFSSGSDDSLRGAMPVIQSGALKNALLIGNGATKWGVSEVKSGRLWADLGAFPATEVAKATTLAIDAARGAKVPAAVPSVSISPLGPDIGLNLTKEALGAHPDFVGEW
jgi:ABC-type sugar transport system substrate-binding protein